MSVDEHTMTTQPSYSVTVRREFIAQHFLVGGDWGRENQLNSHRYRVEARYEGTSLDRHGYLLDTATHYYGLQCDHDSADADAKGRTDRSGGDAAWSGRRLPRNCEFWMYSALRCRDDVRVQPNNTPGWRHYDDGHHHNRAASQTYTAGP